MQERVERLLAALIILALLVLLIIMAWPAAPKGGGKQTASLTGTTRSRAVDDKARHHVPPRDDQYDRRDTPGRVAMRDSGDRPCGSGYGDCDDRPQPPRYDNYGYEIRREPCGGDGPCTCEDSWRPYWAWPRGGCR